MLKKSKKKKNFRLFLLKRLFFDIFMFFYIELRKQKKNNDIMFTFTKYIGKSLQFLNLYLLRKFLYLKRFKRYGRYVFSKKISKFKSLKKNVKKNDTFFVVSKIILKILKRRRISTFIKLLKKKNRHLTLKQRNLLKKKFILKKFIIRNFLYSNMKKNNNYILNDNYFFKYFLDFNNKYLLRWRKKEYFFLFFLENNLKSINLKKYFKNYYKLIFFLKVKLSKLKLSLLYFLKKKYFYFLKNKKISITNLKFILKKYIVLNFFLKKKSLKKNIFFLKKMLFYFNKLFSSILSKLYLNKNLNLNKNFLYNSYIYNVNFSEEPFSLLSINNFFINYNVISKKKGLYLLYNKIFNYFNFIKFDNIKLYKRNNIQIFYENSKLIFWYLYFNLIYWLKYYFYFFQKNNKILNNKFYLNENKIYLIENYFVINLLLKNFNNLKIVNLSFMKYLYKYFIKKNILKNFLIKKFLNKIKNYFLKKKYFIIIFLINIFIQFKYKFFNIYVFFFKLIKKRYFIKLKRLNKKRYFIKLKQMKKRLKIKKNLLKLFFYILKNKLKYKFISKFIKFNFNFINFNFYKNILLKNNIKNNNFFQNLQKNNIYTKYSKRNKRNLNKCILYLIQKRTNNFLVLTTFKKRKVLMHTSGGHGLARRYNNSKRQKKGTRVITYCLAKIYRPIIKQLRFKYLYIKTNSLWNFRVRHLTKFWVYRYKLGIMYLNGVKIFYNFPHHKGLKKSNKRRR